MIEVQVHRQLLQLLRQEPLHPPWPHQLTMGRLVARALHLGRSTLMQVSGSGEHRLSYLLPALSAEQGVVLCIPQRLQQRLLEVELPLLRRYVTGDKPVSFGDRWPHADWRGVYITDPMTFLRSRLSGSADFPEGIVVLFDNAHGLEDWAFRALEQRIFPADWDTFTDRREPLLDWRIQLTRTLLTQSGNRVALDRGLEDRLAGLLIDTPLNEHWQAFAQRLGSTSELRWVEFHRSSNQFSLASTPVDLAPLLAERLWSAQPIVLIGEALDPERQATAFRNRIGLGEVTCLRFPADPREQEVALYLPPDPVDLTSILGQQRLVPMLIELIDYSLGPVVILLDPGPLRQRVATVLASQYGSRVVVDGEHEAQGSIALASWEHWERHHAFIDTPTTLVVGNLPFPSPSDPLVAARVAALKRQHRDWFRDYLLPVMLGRLQRGLSPLRRTQGLVALLDRRILSRSYGQQLLDSLTPARRLRYLERS